MNDEQLAVAAIFVEYKACARAKELEDNGLGEYSTNNPHIASLFSMGLLSMRGKAIMPDRNALIAVLAKHPVPHKYRYIGNWLHSSRAQ